MPSSMLTSDGQAHIPQSIREFMQLEPGDQLRFTIESNGQVTLRPASIDVSELGGLFHDSKRKTVSMERMNEVVRKRAQQEHRKSASAE